MTVTENEIIEVANVVWESMLGLELEPAVAEQGLPVGSFMTGCVLINGAFEGGVTLQVPSDVARDIAALMFGMERDEVSDDETTDAVGELANMVGGNLKALVVQPSKLSLPSVTEGTDYRVSIPGTVATTRCAFQCEGMPVLVALHTRSDSDAAAKAHDHRSHDNPIEPNARSVA
jgi:chemotaxis protein CheX